MSGEASEDRRLPEPVPHCFDRPVMMNSRRGSVRDSSSVRDTRRETARRAAREGEGREVSSGSCKHGTARLSTYNILLLQQQSGCEKTGIDTILHCEIHSQQRRTHTHTRTCTHIYPASVLQESGQDKP